jgi:hypothetical protein
MLFESQAERGAQETDAVEHNMLEMEGHDGSVAEPVIPGDEGRSCER